MTTILVGLFTFIIGLSLGALAGIKLTMNTVVDSMNREPGKWLQRAVEIQRAKQVR